ncbi:hypothetical protein [Roseateles oligotrophus]|uniref:Uncharacterized protein n=1 Tax=Roseateles oligotrophus TaxID=1769250 RepID=A0ABT2Y9E5_9BURK|nr:hypothetical protein [Roseateles oligotrophus]MCV2366940.1 hypothetical protein [Roseateles oligotrophus]
MKSNLKSISCLLCLSVSALILSACGSSDPEPVPPVKTAQINSANYSDVLGIAAGSSDQSEGLMRAGLAPIAVGFTRTQPGSIACVDGGSLDLAIADKLRTYTAVNCKTGPVFIASGTLTESVDSPDGLSRSIKIKDLNLRTSDTDLSMQKVNGDFKVVVKADGSPVSAVIDLSVARNARTDTFALTLDASGNLLIVIDTARFPQKLVITGDAKTNSLKISSRGDGSSLTVIESVDGKSFNLELREPGNNTPTLIKTISATELEALVKKSL